MSKHYPDQPPPYPNAPASDANTFAAWDHRQYAAPPGSVGGAPQYQQGPYGAPPGYGDGIGYPQHRGYPPQRPAYGDGVPYARQQGYQVPPQPMHGDGVPYRQHRGHLPPPPQAGYPPDYAQQRQPYAPQPPRAYPPREQQGAMPAYPQPQPPPAAASSAPKAGEVHIQNRVASPKEAQEKRTSWVLIGLTAFFLVWVFAAALFIFNQMNIL